jgi:hypothetical protein
MYYYQPEPIPLAPHTCFKEIHVVLNKANWTYIEEGLSVDDDGDVATAFDAWVHASLMRHGGAGDYSTF